MAQTAARSSADPELTSGIEASNPPAVVLVTGADILGQALAAALAPTGLPVRLVPPDRCDSDSLAGITAGVVVAPPGPADTAICEVVGALSAAGAKVAVLGPGSGPATLNACLEAGAALLIPWGAGLDQFVSAVATLAGVREASLPRQEAPQSNRARAACELLDSLTGRERAVLADLVAGRRAAAIARASYVSLHTVRSQIRSILDKLDVHSQLEAVAVARRAGWPSG